MFQFWAGELGSFTTIFGRHRLGDVFRGCIDGRRGVIIDGLHFVRGATVYPNESCDRPTLPTPVDRRPLLRNASTEDEAIGTDWVVAARNVCTTAFATAYAKFVEQTRDKLKNASAKDWWKTSKQLLSQANGSENIPALKSDDGWAKQPSEKASLLASTFSAKSRLPVGQVNDFSAIPSSDVQLRRFLRLRVRTVRKILRDLDESSATGPDLLPAMILRQCAPELALPITLLARLCLREGRWPVCWRQHWVHPLHKRKARSDPKMYRGVHLTPQLAKVVERGLGSLFIPWMAEHCYGEHQYAYTTNKSHRDVLVINVCCWLLLLEAGLSVGLYCSDVSGAFDRVVRGRMAEKLLASGLPRNVVEFLLSWLEDRLSNVVVGGSMSIDEVLANSVFQGTVLGPPLWNLFYADSRHAVRRHEFTETIFADDFNCWKGLPNDVDDLTLVLALSECQSSLHAWGAANQVVFDPTKESFHLLRRQKPRGPSFKLLGVLFDTKLLMHEGARAIAVDAGWRLQAVLRPRRFFSTPELMRLYKSLVLSFIESGTPGYFHAAPSVLACIDRIQRRFLREIGLSDVEALLDYRLAPLDVRRDIATLGLLHRVNLGLVSEQMAELFPKVGERPVLGDFPGARVRSAVSFHNRQLFDRITANSSEQLRRSILGMVRVYNTLPQHCVEPNSVKKFQRRLQFCVMERAKEGNEEWRDIFTVGRRYAAVLRFQSFFRL